MTHDVGLNTALARLGGQCAVVAGTLAIVWLAATMLTVLRRRPAQPPSDLASDVAAAIFAAAVAASAAVLLRSSTADPLAYSLRAAAGCALLVLFVALAVSALRAARARRIVARAAVTVADNPAGGAAGALAAALNDPGLRVAYPAADGAWRDHRGQMVVRPERDLTMVTDEGEIVAALIHGSPAGSLGA